jgi:histidinol-phosphate aminotransferase
VNAVVKRVSERIAALPVYQPGKPPMGSPIGKLSSNESSLGTGPAMSRAIVAAVDQLHLYPYEESTTTTLATSLGVPCNHVLLSNGSDELCFLIATVFLGAGRTAVVGDPCYAIDATATLISGAQLTRVPLVDGAHDLDRLASTSQSADVVWLPTPHNPTGVAVTQEQIFEFVSKTPETCLVVIDQAYGGFVDDEFVIDPASVAASLFAQRTWLTIYDNP